jgi:hypothetical protein
MSHESFISLDTLARGRFMRDQRLLCGTELLPNGTEMQVIKVVEVRDQKISVVWEYWREAQMRSYHGSPTEYDLGEIS